MLDLVSCCSEPFRMLDRVSCCSEPFRMLDLVSCCSEPFRVLDLVSCCSEPFRMLDLVSCNKVQKLFLFFFLGKNAFYAYRRPTAVMWDSTAHHKVYGTTH